MVLLVLFLGWAAVGAQQLIVHPDVAVSAIRSELVRSFFTMRLRRWPDGTPVQVFVLPDGNATHRAFSKHVLKVFPHQLRRAWDRRVFAGTGQAPEQTENEAQMLDRVASTPGAVGYVSDGTVDGRVRILELE